MNTFRQTLSDLSFIPNRLTGMLALLVPCIELGAVVLIILDHQFTLAGLSLSAILLLTFTGVIAYVLRKNTSMSCNCFGMSVEGIGPYHLLRNVVLIIFTLVALLPFSSVGHTRVDLAPVEWLLTSIAALISVGLLVNLHHIVRIVRSD